MVLVALVPAVFVASALPVLIFFGVHGPRGIDRVLLARRNVGRDRVVVGIVVRQLATHISSLPGFLVGDLGARSLMSGAPALQVWLPAGRKAATCLLHNSLGRENRMNVFGRLSAAALVTIAAATASIAPAQAAAPVLIKSCTVNKPKPMSHMASGTNIVYVNLGKKTAASVTFLVGYRNASQHYLRRVQDVGSFAPGATINHNLSLYNDVTYSGAQTAQCAAVEVKWAGGTLWIAPSSH